MPPSSLEVYLQVLVVVYYGLMPWGIPTGSTGEPVEALADIVFGHPDLNTQTLTTDILRATITRDIAETSKAIFSITNNQ